MADKPVAARGSPSKPTASQYVLQNWRPLSVGLVAAVLGIWCLVLTIICATRDGKGPVGPEGPAGDRGADGPAGSSDVVQWVEFDTPIPFQSAPSRTTQFNLPFNIHKENVLKYDVGLQVTRTGQAQASRLFYDDFLPKNSTGLVNGAWIPLEMFYTEDYEPLFYVTEREQGGLDVYQTRTRVQMRAADTANSYDFNSPNRSQFLQFRWRVLVNRDVADA